MNNITKTEIPRSIMIDTTFLFDQYGMRGIGRFGKEVLKRLIPDIFQTGSWDLHFVGFHDLEKNLVEIGLSSLSIDEYKDKIVFHSLGEPFDSSVKNRDLWLKLFQPVIDSQRPSVYFAFHFERGLPHLSKSDKKVHYIPKTVVVAHDAIPFQTNSFSSKSYFHNIVKKRFYKQMWEGVLGADLIISPSDYSKRMLVKHAKLQEEKIVVTHLGVDPSFYKENKTYDENDVNAILGAFQLADQSYFLYDSGIEANKGIFELFDMFEHLFSYKRTKVPKTLVMIGGHFEKGRGNSIIPKSKEAKKALQYAKKKNILLSIQTTGRIPDNELIILLHHAYAHINFSKIEGFNLGPIQAMAAQVPTIVANASCNPEVTQEKALLVNTKKSKSTAKEIKQYFENSRKKSTKVKQAFEVAQTYTWDATSEKIWDNIKELF